jgi:ABC-type Fe3+/spermidine/putrescine transport system ATPase subunit
MEDSVATNQTQPLVLFDHVTKRFGPTTAVDSISLQIFEGEFLSIMGPSGCGKTTTLRMLAGLEEPSEGEIQLAGERINNVTVSERDTPMVWQSLALFPFLNVIKNVEFGLKMRGSVTSDLASATRCCCPPESWLISRSAKSTISSLSSQSRARRRRSVTDTPRIFSPNSTFLITFRKGNRARDCQTIGVSRSETLTLFWRSPAS